MILSIILLIAGAVFIVSGTIALAIGVIEYKDEPSFAGGPAAIMLGVLFIPGGLLLFISQLSSLGIGAR